MVVVVAAVLPSPLTSGRRRNVAANKWHDGAASALSPSCQLGVVRVHQGVTRAQASVNEYGNVLCDGLRGTRRQRVARLVRGREERLEEGKRESALALGPTPAGLSVGVEEAGVAADWREASLQAGRQAQRQACAGWLAVGRTVRHREPLGHGCLRCKPPLRDSMGGP